MVINAHVFRKQVSQVHSRVRGGNVHARAGQCREGGVHGGGVRVPVQHALGAARNQAPLAAGRHRCHGRRGRDCDLRASHARSPRTVGTRGDGVLKAEGSIDADTRHPREGTRAAAYRPRSDVWDEAAAVQPAAAVGSQRIRLHLTKRARIEVRTSQRRRRRRGRERRLGLRTEQRPCGSSAAA